jgi:hypothetical protein
MTRTFAQMTVTFSDGKSDTEIVDFPPSMSVDKVFHALQASKDAFWDGFKRTTGGQYQVLKAGNFIDALIETSR